MVANDRNKCWRQIPFRKSAVSSRPLLMSHLGDRRVNAIAAPIGTDHAHCRPNGILYARGPADPAARTASRPRPTGR